MAIVNDQVCGGDVRDHDLGQAAASAAVVNAGVADFAKGCSTARLVPAFRA